MNRLPAPIEYEEIVVPRPSFAESKLAMVVVGVLVGLTGFGGALALGLFG
ncbi:hypothetical protein [Phenylobacterium montanum]|uniref:Uncharacterized protein n=1 Tax=Phenylobacterium montanum TaxID=2823693 RepID=A0A975G153_9CAUL|nr:hypothetical protein [Caulobacter sp. S6]QUD88572.1 hypothetical protein KCG34_01385 [Caulobacter sp. S6]